MANKNHLSFVPNTGCMGYVFKLWVGVGFIYWQHSPSGSILISHKDDLLITCMMMKIESSFPSMALQCAGSILVGYIKNAMEA